MLFVWDFLNNSYNCFWTIRVVLKRTFKLLTAEVLKGTDLRQVEWVYFCCVASADCGGVTP